MSAIDLDLTLALAKAQANLDLITSRSDVLSDLGDLKEVKRLDSECALLIRDQAKSGRVPPDPLAALESEVVALIAWGKEVQALLDEGMELLDPDRLVADEDTADKIGMADINAQQAELNTFRGLLADRTAGLAGRRPTACFTDRGFDPRVADLWRIRAAGRTRGGVGLGENIPAFDALRRWVDSPGGRPSEEQRALLKRLDDRADELATYATERADELATYATESAAERAELVAASAQLETGNPRAARALAVRPRAKRYADPLWSALESELAAMDSAIAKVEGAVGLRKVIAAEELSAWPIWAKVKPESELGASLRATADKARRGRKMRRITLAVSVAVLCVAGVFANRIDLAVTVAVLGVLAACRTEKMRERGSSPIFIGAAAKIFVATKKKVSSRVSGTRAGFSLAGDRARAVLRRGGLVFQREEPFEVIAYADEGPFERDFRVAA